MKVFLKILKTLTVGKYMKRYFKKDKMKITVG